MSIVQQALLFGDNVQLPDGWTPEGVRQAVAESVIDRHRFADPGSAVLARYEDVDGIFPATEELVARGVDVEQLAIAFNNGL
ncbi:MAG: hypothetical protein K2X97_06770, partial [Mycobacteriaceae bacterium]|nr:hypothetical protein [Mycobacteriaceae bacterium]